MKDNDTIVHLVTPYLFHTGSWIYSQIKNINKFQSVVFTYSKENLDVFPHDEVVSFDEFPIKYRIFAKIHRKIFGDHYGIYFREYLNKYKPVLLHAHQGQEGTRWLNFSRENKIPLVTSFYGMDVSKLGRIPYWQKRYKELFQYGTIFLAEGNNLKNQLIALGCPTYKIIVQHLGVSVDSYSQKKNYINNNSQITVLQVSSFREKKGIIYSLQAVAKVIEKNKNVIFKIIGDGDQKIKTTYNALVEQLQIKRNVKFLGIKSHAEMIKIMLDADIFIHPSVTASDGDNEGGAPVSIIEASAIGLPIVTTNHADIPEVVVNNKTGLLSDEKNIDDLASSLVRLTKSHKLRKSLGEAGVAHISANYNLPIQIRKLEEIYRIVIGEKA